MVVDSFLDGTDGELQGAVSHLAGLGTHLGWLYVDEAPLLQLANVLGHRVGAHAGVLANLPDAGPALMGFPVLAEDQVGVDGQLAWGQSQGEDLIWQKKKSSQWAAVGVSVLEFRGVSSPMIFYDSTPTHETMSIEKSNFTLRSQVYSCKCFPNLFRRSPYSLFSPPQILRWPLPCLGVSERLEFLPAFA